MHSVDIMMLTMVPFHLDLVFLLELTTVAVVAVALLVLLLAALS